MELSESEMKVGSPITNSNGATNQGTGRFELIGAFWIRREPFRWL